MRGATISLVGVKNLRDELGRISADVKREVGAEVMDVAAELHADIVLSIQRGPKTGRLYTRGNVVHRASKAGETPASDTGALMQSIYHEKTGDLSASVGSRLVYALFLEYGTTKMGARPFFRPAVERMRPKFNNRIEAAVRRATQ